jgi:hypothetical protein
VHHHAGPPHVDRQQRATVPGRPAQQLAELERNVDAAAHRRQHFGPGPRSVETVGLGEADQRGHGGAGGEQKQAAVVQVRGGVEKDPRIARRRVEVQVLDDPRRHRVHIAVDQRQQPARREQHDGALEGLEEGDRADRGGATHARRLTLCAAPHHASLN